MPFVSRQGILDIFENPISSFDFCKQDKVGVHSLAVISFFTTKQVPYAWGLYLLQI